MKNLLLVLSFGLSLITSGIGVENSLKSSNVSSPDPSLMVALGTLFSWSFPHGYTDVKFISPASTKVLISSVSYLILL